MGEEKDSNPKTKQNGVAHSPSTVNIIMYVLCATSVGLSVYTSYCQTHFEDRIRHLRHLNDRVMILEAKLQSHLLQPHLSTQATRTTTTTAPFLSTTITTATATQMVDGGAAGAAGSGGGGGGGVGVEFSNLVNKLSYQVSGIERLRRDVSYLQRRGERQASVQQSPECVCPPGNK